MSTNLSERRMIKAIYEFVKNQFEKDFGFLMQF